MGQLSTLPGDTGSLCETLETEPGSRSTEFGDAMGHGSLAWHSSSVPLIRDLHLEI